MRSVEVILAEIDANGAVWDVALQAGDFEGGEVCADQSRALAFELRSAVAG